MSTSLFAPDTQTSLRVDTGFFSPRQKWMKETRIEPMDPKPGLKCHRVGNETHFQGYYMTQWFRIMFPVSELFFEGDGMLDLCALNFKTIDNARITDIEIYDGPALLWAKSGMTLRGDYRSGIARKNSWEFNPGLSFTEDIYAALCVEFCNPNVWIPELVFHEARALLSRGNEGLLEVI